MTEKPLITEKPRASNLAATSLASFVGFFSGPASV